MKNIRLRNVHNARDLGGLAVQGGVIRSGMLLRSAHLNGVRQGDIRRLVLKHRLKTVIDLRNTAEKLELPNANIGGVHFEEMPIFDGSVPGMSHEAKQDIEHIPDMCEIYRHVAENQECLGNLAAVVRRIVTAREDEFAVLYHCTEGKDRTGMVTALLLTVLGADRQTIYDDYLFTNTVNRKKAVGYFLLVRIFKHNKTAAQRVYNVFLARREYLDELFKVVDAMGEEAFIREVLQLTEAEIAAFRKRVVTAR